MGRKKHRGNVVRNMDCIALVRMINNCNKEITSIEKEINALKKRSRTLRRTVYKSRRKLMESAGIHRTFEGETFRPFGDCENFT